MSIFCFCLFCFFPCICGMLFPFMSFVFVNFPLISFFLSCYLLSLPSGFPLCLLFCLSSSAACFALSHSPTSIFLACIILLYHVLFSCALPPIDFPIGLTSTGLLTLQCAGRLAQYKSGFWPRSRHFWLFFFFPFFFFNK